MSNWEERINDLVSNLMKEEYERGYKDGRNDQILRQANHGLAVAEAMREAYGLAVGNMLRILEPEQNALCPVILELNKDRTVYDYVHCPHLKDDVSCCACAAAFCLQNIDKNLKLK